MKNRINCFLLFMAVSITTAAASARYKEGSFPQLESGRLNGILENALKKIDCRITSANGVGHTSNAHDKTNPISCHKVGMAIDIWNLSCATGSNDKRQKLQRLYDALNGILKFAVVCYNRQGPCPDPHVSHLHFGAIQSWPVSCRF